jgi:hypothetical protein
LSRYYLLGTFKRLCSELTKVLSGLFFFRDIDENPAVEVLTFNWKNTDAETDAVLGDVLFDHQPPACGDGAVETVRMDKFLGRPAQKLVIGTLEHGSKRRVDKPDARLGVHQQHAVWSVLQYRTRVRVYLVFRKFHTQLSFRPELPPALLSFSRHKSFNLVSQNFDGLFNARTAESLFVDLPVNPFAAPLHTERALQLDFVGETFTRKEVTKTSYDVAGTFDVTRAAHADRHNHY